MVSGAQHNREIRRKNEVRAIELPWTDLTVQNATDKLSALHFSQECLTVGELEILYIAEGLLRLVNPLAYGLKDVLHDESGQPIAE